MAEFTAANLLQSASERASRTHELTGPDAAADCALTSTYADVFISWAE
jgi:hypothetical protein